MTKAMSKDSEIIVKMMQVQDKINEWVDTYEDNQTDVKKEDICDILKFYVIQMFSLRKNMSGKSKKALTFFDDFVGKTVLESMNYCYPMISDNEIVSIAKALANTNSRDMLSTQYANCIKESPNYEAD